ncbi:BRCT domain-containing protein [Haloplanus rubicundus]|nr:BRCT domain-containing protein [Haloplanus rubicundus]
MAKGDLDGAENVSEDNPYIVEPERTQAETGDELTDVTIVFTGSVESWTRDELEALVERHGGDATDSVSGNTEYLVVGENPGETNQEDAEADNVSELDPGEFFDLLADRGVDFERESSQ